MRSWRTCSLWLVGVALVVVSGCSGGAVPPDLGEAEGLGEPADRSSRPASGPGEPGSGPVLVALGDSLTAGLGVGPDSAYPALLEAKLHEAGYGLRVVNAGVSGDTSAGALRRLDWALDGQSGPVAALIVALGGNDGLRGLSVTQLRDNLAAIITGARDRGVPVLLAGMEAPPNFGTAYTDSFRGVYRELAEEYEVVFVPFLLEGVAGVADLNQADGIHPNEEGAARVAAHLWPAVETLARRVVVAD